MKIIHCEQGSGEWTNLRLGRVTASEADALITPKGEIRTGAGPTSFLYRKVTEKLLGFQINDGGSFAMNQGHITEGEALAWFAFEHDVKIDRVGFCLDDSERYGFSPDGLIGQDGGIEIKSPQPQKHLQYLFENAVPNEYVIQVQFSLFVSKRKWWKFVSFSRQFPALVVHVEPDPKIQEAIGTALTAFLARFDSVYTKMAKTRDADIEAKQAEYFAKDPDYLAWAAKQKAAGLPV